MQLKEAQYRNTGSGHTGPFGIFWNQSRATDQGWCDRNLIWYLACRGDATARQIGRGDLCEGDFHRIAMELYSDQAWLNVADDALVHSLDAQQAIHHGTHRLSFERLLETAHSAVFEGVAYAVDSRKNEQGIPPPASAFQTLPRSKFRQRLESWAFVKTR